jgi:hypothetical protein
MLTDLEVEALFSTVQYDVNEHNNSLKEDCKVTQMSA